MKRGSNKDLKTMTTKQALRITRMHSVTNVHCKSLIRQGLFAPKSNWTAKNTIDLKERKLDC